MVLQFTLSYKTDCAHKLIYGILSKISDIGVLINSKETNYFFTS